MTLNPGVNPRREWVLGEARLGVTLRSSAPELLRRAHVQLRGIPSDGSPSRILLHHYVKEGRTQFERLAAGTYEVCALGVGEERVRVIHVPTDDALLEVEIQVD